MNWRVTLPITLNEQTRGQALAKEVQLDNITAGATQPSVNVAANVAATATLNYVAAVNTAVAANVAAMVALNNLGG